MFAINARYRDCLDLCGKFLLKNDVKSLIFRVPSKKRLSSMTNIGNMDWRPETFLNSELIKKADNYAVIVLNRPIHAEKGIVEHLWSHASMMITVDGGTNRWLQWLRANKLEGKLKPPNFITGDLDSCHLESLEFFKGKSKVIHTENQDETDFTKSLYVLEPFIQKLNLKNVIALCDTSGRVDQILGNINTLHKNQLKSPELSRPVFILSSNSLSWLLAVGSHTIHIPDNFKTLWCALVPFEPTEVTTTGLKWNLSNQTLKFGGIVSTSNTYACNAEFVTVTTDKPILWSMGIKNIDEDD